MLTTAIASSDRDPLPLLHAIYWLESAVAIEGRNCASSLLKNVGLAHLRAVQNKAIPDDVRILDVVPDVLNTSSVVRWPEPNQR